MARRLAQLTAFAFCLSPALAMALGIGSIETRSALNEPLDARIPLVPDGVDDIDSVSISLAPTEAFQRVGLDRPFHLSRLEFNVVTDDGAEPYVSVTTEDSVREPFLAFVVEVRWPGGRMLREYTLLLDPPVDEPREAPAPRMAAEPDPAPVPEPEVAREPDPEPELARPATEDAPADAAPGTDYGPVQRNQTLWDIAMETRPDSSVSVHQMMMALLRANPDAFIDGNVNNLRAGAILRVPDQPDVESMSVADARREFARQNEEWQAGRAPAVAEAEPEPDPEPEVAEEPAELEDRLQVVAAGEGGGEDPTATLDNDDDLGAARDEVRRLEEELTAMRESEASLESEADELREMNRELRERVEALERVVNIQADPALVEGEEADPLDDVPMAGDATEDEADPAVAAGTGDIADEDEAAVAEDESTAEDDDVPAIAAAEPPAAEGAGADPELAGDPAGSEVEAPQASAPAEDPLASTSPAAPWEDPRVLAGGGGAVLLLAALLMLVRRRRQAAEEEFEPVATTGGGAAALAGAGAGAGAAAAAPAADEHPAADSAPGAPAQGSQPDPVQEPLAEADMYMGHGRYDQAREVIQRGLETNPEDSALRLKLLEIHALAHDRAAFEAEAVELYGVVDGNDDPVWQQASEMGREIAPEHPLFGGDGTAAEEAQPVADADDSDLTDLDAAFELDTTDEAGPRDTSLESDRRDAPVDMESMGDDLSDLEFALDDDAGGDPAAEERTVADSTAAVADAPAEQADDDPFNLDFDVAGMEADRERRNAAAESASAGDPPQAADDDNLLDFDLEPSDEAKASEPETGSDSSPLAGETLASEDEPSGHASMADADGGEFDLDDLEFEIDEPVDARQSGDDAGAEVAADSGAESDRAAALPEFDVGGTPDETVEAGEGDAGDDDDLFAGADENSTKLDLARAYLDMGDSEGARSLLEEVVEEGSEEQKREAEELMGQTA